MPPHPNSMLGMMVLCRYEGEDLIITPPSGERIVVRLIEIRGRKIRLGVSAPRSVVVNRGEVQERIDDGSDT